MARILIAEDDPLQADLVSRYLRREGHEVSVVDAGDAALTEVVRRPPQLLVLDVMLPGLDGLDVVRGLRERELTVPVLMLTARSTENDLILGLELGADDYLAKPYSPRELVARVRALLRRGATADAVADPAASTRVAVGDLVIDPRTREAWVAGEAIVLTRAEFELLDELVAHRDAVLSRGQLLARLHGIDRYIGERTIDAHIKNLRAKIESDPRAPRRLLTVYGVGYRLVAPDPDRA